MSSPSYYWNCSRRLPETANFCQDCGAPQNTGWQGIFIPGTRREVEECIQQDNSLQPGTDTYIKVKREVGAALSDCILLSKVSGFSLQDVVFSDHFHSLNSGSRAAPEVGEMGRERRRNLLGFFILLV